jgi:hypothetical protein
MKKHNLFPTLLYIASALFNVAAIVFFAGGSNTALGAISLCLGSSLLCVATACARKSRENEEKPDDTKKEN